MNLKNYVATIENYPKEGILFRDITPLMNDGKAYKYATEKIVEFAKEHHVDIVVGPEARGFIFASVTAEHLALPLILVRKKGKLPGEVYSESYDLEYGTATIEVHKTDIVKEQNILVIDDLIATGGTLTATKKIIEKAGAHVVAFLGVIGLPFLHYEDVLKGVPVYTLIQFDHE